MRDKNIVTRQGIVVESLPNATFRVQLENKEGDNLVLAHICGKMRMYKIKLLPGDKVLMEMSPYDQDKGRIIRRL